MSDISLRRTIHVDEDTSITLALRDLLAQAGYTSTTNLELTELLTALPDGEYAEGDTPLFGRVDDATLYVRPGAWQPDFHGEFTTYQIVVANGGDLVTLELRVIVDPVNDAPTGADRAFELATRAPLVLTTQDFGFADAIDGDAFESIIVTTLPAAGTMLLNGVAIAAGAEIGAADIAAGRLAFVPSATSGGVVELGFHVRDDGGTSGSGARDTSVAINHLTFKVPVPPAEPDTGTGTNPPTPPASGGSTLAKIGDTVWDDANANGIQDAGEAGIAGVAVTLRDASGAVVATTTTDTAGRYGFDVGSGTYIVAVAAPEGYVATTKGAGTDRGADSDVNADGTTDAFAVVKGDVDNGADAGFVRAAALAGTVASTVWEDRDGDGVQDAGESGVAGAQVHLVDAKGVTVASTVTDANGAYGFTAAAGTYTVRIDKPAGYQFTATAAGGDRALDSDVDTAGLSAQFAVTAGQATDAGDAGMYRGATLGNRVWCDSDGDGIQDSGESGVGGIKVTLLDAGGKAIASTKTDAGGQYAFAGIKPGTYTVQFDKATLPSGYVFTRRDAGSDDARDADTDANGLSHQVTLASGSVDMSVDAGVARAATIGDRVWYDTDGDGVQGLFEAGAANVQVTLKDTAGEVVATTKTDAWGNYKFAVAAGTYTVNVQAPENYGFTQKNATFFSGFDSDADASGNLGTVTVAAGGSANALDAGLVQAAIRSTVWEDADFDGVQDSGECGVAGVTVRLYDAQHNLKATTVTAADGSYAFGKLAAGSYSVEVVRPAGYFATKANVGADTTDSDFTTVGTATSSGLFQLAAGAQNTTIDAGLYRKAAIGDKVWRDANHNGVQDSGEEGIGKIKVMLYDAGTSKLLASTTTDAKGNYLFSNLDPGSYYLKFDKTDVKFTDAKGATYAMNDWKWGVKNTGTNDAIDSDVKGDGISKTGLTQTDATTLTSGENDMSWDAAITPIALDLDGDGIHTIARADFAGSFDLLGTGTAIRSGWLSAGDAFLAIDANGNGRIDGIGELFGGAAKGSGFAKLASFDSDGDGYVTAADAQFSALTLWQDANSDGATDAGELVSLAQAGVTALAVAFEELPFLDANGNLHLERSSAVIGGATVAMTDVYFNVAAADVSAAGLDVTNMATLIGQPTAA